MIYLIVATEERESWMFTHFKGYEQQLHISLLFTSQLVT